MRKVEKYAFLTVVSALVYSLVFSYFTFLRHSSFYSAGWDLGNFNQAFYTTLFDGKLFYYTADSFFSPSGSIFAIHTSPFLFLILPFYAISPSPVTLMIIKSFGVGVAAIPLYFLAKKLLEDSKAGFLIVLVYLLYPALQGASWFDFQQTAFLALFLFLTYFLMINKNWKLYFPIMVLTLMIEEHVAVIVAILAIYYFTIHSNITSLRKSLRSFRMNEGLASMLTIAICAIYFLAAILIKNSFPVNSYFADVYKASANFKILGSSDTLSIPINALLNPQRAFEALNFDFVNKFLYLAFLFSPLLFIPLRNRFVFGIAFLLMPFILSNYLPYYQLGVHYPFYVIPIIFIGAIYGIRRLEANGRMFTLKTMIVVTLLFALCLSPLSPLSRVFVQQGAANYSPIEFSLDENEKSLNGLLNLLPPNASVLTQNLIFPHVSNRLNAYVIPFYQYDRPEQMREYVDHLLSNVEFVVLDTRYFDNMARMVLRMISENDAYGPYALGTKAIVFKRGYHGDPINVYYTNNRTFLVYRDLLLSTPPGSIISDSSSASKSVFSYPKEASGCSIYGPYIYLLGGLYEVTFTVKVGQHSLGWLGTFDVATDLGTRTISSRDTYGFEMKTGEWTNVTVSFGLSGLTEGIEFRFVSQGTAEVVFDQIKVRRISANTTNYSMMSIHARDLKLSSGSETEERFLFHQNGTTNEIFWFGPYWSFSPGNYTATFLLRIVPTPNEAEHSIITLIISGKTEETMEPILLGERTLYTQEFMDNNDATDWGSYRVNFTVSKPMIDMELRGLLPSPECDIYLAYILLERSD